MVNQYHLKITGASCCNLPYHPQVPHRASVCHRPRWLIFYTRLFWGFDRHSFGCLWFCHGHRRYCRHPRPWVWVWYSCRHRQIGCHARLLFVTHTRLPWCSLEQPARRFCYPTRHILQSHKYLARLFDMCHQWRYRHVRQVLAQNLVPWYLQGESLH